MKCKYCESGNLAERPNPPHIELYCVDCCRHQKFVKQEHTKGTGELASEKQQRYAISLLVRWKNSKKRMTTMQAGAIIQAFKE